MINIFKKMLYSLLYYKQKCTALQPILFHLLIENIITFQMIYKCSRITKTMSTLLSITYIRKNKAFNIIFYIPLYLKSIQTIGKILVFLCFHRKIHVNNTGNIFHNWFGTSIITIKKVIVTILTIQNSKPNKE